jgi:hypothetical protein
MGGLRSAIDEYRLEDLHHLTDGALEEGFTQLQEAAQAIESERLRWLGEIHRRGAVASGGFLSTPAWLAGTFKLGWGEARGQVRVAKALDDMPETKQAFEQGQVSSSSVKLLVEAKEAEPTAFAQHEGALVDAARGHTVEDLRKVVGYWRQAVDQAEPVEQEERLRARRHLHLSPMMFGMLRVDGELDPETGESVLTALGAIQDAWSRVMAGMIGASLRSAGPTQWGSWPGNGWTGRIVRSWPESVPI